jgi:hypothetical protein
MFPAKPLRPQSKKPLQLKKQLIKKLCVLCVSVGKFISILAAPAYSLPVPVNRIINYNFIPLIKKS